MNYFGLIAFFTLIMYSDYPKRVKKLEEQVKKLKRATKGEKSLSKLINDLKGKKCVMRCEDAYNMCGDFRVTCEVIDVDDEWVKVTFKDKGGETKTRIIRIESIENIEVDI